MPSDNFPEHANLRIVEKGHAALALNFKFLSPHLLPFA